MLVDMYEVSKRDFLGIEFCFSFYLGFLIVHGMGFFFKDKVIPLHLMYMINVLSYYF